MRPNARKLIRTVLAHLVGAVALVWSTPGNAGCTWKFDWYCSGCAKIGGRTTGERGGYASEAACESARSAVRSPVTTMSCDRVGTCDAPPPPPRRTQGETGESRGQAHHPTPDYDAQRRMEAEIKAQEEARQSAEADRKAREQAAFDRAKADLMNQLKGGTLDQGSGLKGVGGGDTLSLKSGTPTFGIKGNPGGNLHLKNAPAVKVLDPETAKIDPSFFIRPKARLKIRDVPNPLAAPRGTWLHYVKSSRAGLILDALEEGQGDLDEAISWLDGQIIAHDANIRLTAALSYLEGLKTSYIAAGDEYRKRVAKFGEPTTLDSKELLAAVSGRSALQWPGPKNPDPRPSRHDWRVQRTTMMLQALEENPGDLEKAVQALQRARDGVTAENAEHYLRGVYAYWDYLGRENSR